MALMKCVHNRNTQLHAAPEYFLTIGAKTPVESSQSTLLTIEQAGSILGHSQNPQQRALIIVPSKLTQLLCTILIITYYELCQAQDNTLVD